MGNFRAGYQIGKDLAEIRINMIRLGDQVNQLTSEVNSLRARVRELESRMDQRKK